MISKFSISTVLILLLIHTSYSQEVNLFVKNIKEERNSNQSDSYLELEASISGLKVDEFNQIKIGEITKAVDNQGNVLKKIDSYFGEDYSSENEIKIKIEAPFRSATKIKTLEGTIKYFSPSEQNDSKIIITQPLEKLNTNLLKSYTSEIKLTLVNKAEMEKWKAQDEKKYQKELEKLKKEGTIEAAVAESVDVFKKMFEGFSTMGDDASSFSFIITDKKESLIDIFVYNEKGEKMNYGSSTSGDFKTISLKEEPKNTWSIEVLLENEKSLKEVKFSISEIVLP